MGMKTHCEASSQASNWWILLEGHLMKGQKRSAPHGGQKAFDEAKSRSAIEEAGMGWPCKRHQGVTQTHAHVGQERTRQREEVIQIRNSKAKQSDAGATLRHITRHIK